MVPPGSSDGSRDGHWEPLRCHVRPQRDELWISPEGELDLESAPLVRDCLREYLEADFRRIVVDLGGLTFMDSSGLRVIVDAHRVAGARGIELDVIQGPPAVRRIFEITGTAELLSAPHRR